MTRQYEEMPEPIFIIGAPRSGTSAMNWAIGQHPNIQVMPETSWIASFATGAMSSYRKGSERGRFSHLSNVSFPSDIFYAHVAECVDNIVNDVYETRCRQLYGNYETEGIKINPANPNAPYQVRRSPDDPKSRWIDATPLNSHFAWAIAMIFPRAKFIHNVRNPADVALSLENFDRVGARALSLSRGLRTWMQHTENAWLAEKAFGPERVFRLEFERLESEPEAMMRDVLDFLDEDWSEACLEPLARKTNSSEVGDKQPNLVKRIFNRLAYRKATALYEALHQPVSEAARRDASRKLEENFESHLAQRPLL